MVRKDPRFIDYFQQATPVSELGRINIGSRPSKRKAAGSIDDLRAIPWIFAWTQIRFHLPVWLGIGEAFQVSGSQSSRHPLRRETLKDESEYAQRLFDFLCVGPVEDYGQCKQLFSQIDQIPSQTLAGKEAAGKAMSTRYLLSTTDKLYSMIRP